MQGNTGLHTHMAGAVAQLVVSLPHGDCFSALIYNNRGTLFPHTDLCVAEAVVQCTHTPLVPNYFAFTSPLCNLIIIIIIIIEG